MLSSATFDWVYVYVDVEGDSEGEKVFVFSLVVSEGSVVLRLFVLFRVVKGWACTFLRDKCLVVV